MSELNGILIAAIVLIALFQPTEDRRFVATLYAVLCAGHYIAFYESDGLMNYGFAALFDLIVVLFTVKLRVLSHAIQQIQNICIVSILLNGAGWAMWMLYMPPHAYNAAFVALYAWAIITLLRREADDGVYTVGARHRYVFTDNSKSHN